MDPVLLRQRIRYIVEFGGIFPQVSENQGPLLVIALLVAAGDALMLAQLLNT